MLGPSGCAGTAATNADKAALFLAKSVGWRLEASGIDEDAEVFRLRVETPLLGPAPSLPGAALEALLSAPRDVVVLAVPVAGVWLETLLASD